MRTTSSRIRLLTLLMAGPLLACVDATDPAGQPVPVGLEAKSDKIPPPWWPNPETSSCCTLVFMEDGLVTVSGVVRDRKGRPVEGALVLVWNGLPIDPQDETAACDCYPPSIVNGWVPTDADGRFSDDEKWSPARYISVSVADPRLDHWKKWAELFWKFVPPQN